MSHETGFRRHVFKVKEEEGLTYQETADRFRVSIRSLFRWKNKPEYDKKRTRAGLVDLDRLKKDIEDKPDDYQYERAKRFGVSRSSVNRALKKIKVSVKKKRFIIRKKIQKNENHT